MLKRIIDQYKNLDLDVKDNISIGFSYFLVFISLFLPYFESSNNGSRIIKVDCIACNYQHTLKLGYDSTLFWINLLIIVFLNLSIASKYKLLNKIVHFISNAFYVSFLCFSLMIATAGWGAPHGAIIKAGFFIMLVASLNISFKTYFIITREVNDLE